MGWFKRLLGREHAEETMAAHPEEETRRVTPAIGSEEEERETRARMEAELEAQRRALPRE
ncbi:MAG TPA: hypothetical protein VFY90_12605 [Tepidiformaceae bacterium]|nr:hypothetical protein [Tepidiformaceae bacterium]